MERRDIIISRGRLGSSAVMITPPRRQTKLCPLDQYPYSKEIIRNNMSMCAVVDVVQSISASSV